jgi:hypothetical protein
MFSRSERSGMIPSSFAILAAKRDPELDRLPRLAQVHRP